MQTFFGKTARLVGEAQTVSHFQRAVLAIGDYLIYLAVGLVSLLFLVGLHRHWPLLELAQFALILTVASIPVAMPAVLSVTMAVGALVLSRMKAIVSRLESIEEMAGMDILCSDKTGTLTQNRLTLGEPVRFAAKSDDDLILAAALASKEEDGDAIDLAILQGVHDPASLARHHQEHFLPFDPVRKRTEATVSDADGQPFQVTKGAPQVIADLCHLSDARPQAREPRPSTTSPPRASAPWALPAATTASGGTCWASCRSSTRHGRTRPTPSPRRPSTASGSRW